MAVTLKPRDLRMRAIEEVATPLPIPEITPPETKITLVFITLKNPPSLTLWRTRPSFAYVTEGLPSEVLTKEGPLIFSQSWVGIVKKRLFSIFLIASYTSPSPTLGYLPDGRRAGCRLSSRS